MTTTFRTTLAVILVAAAAVASPTGARAEPRPQPPGAQTVASARSHFARGVRLYEEDDFRAALIEFNRAYELAPNWAVLYNVGQAHYQLRDYANALRTLDRYEREGGERIAADRRAQVDRELEELRGRVAHVSVAVNVEEAELALDDAPLGRVERGEPFLIGAGRHTLRASKPGYRSATRVVDIAGGDNVRVELDLTEESPLPLATPRAPEPRSYVAAGLTLGVGAAGLAVGAGFGLAALANKSSLNKDCDARKVCPPSAQGEIDAFARNGTVSTVGFGVGLAGVALGAYFFFHERSKESPAAERQGSARSATVVPWLGPASAGVAGTF